MCNRVGGPPGSSRTPRSAPDIGVASGAVPLINAYGNVRSLGVPAPARRRADKPVPAGGAADHPAGVPIGGRRNRGGDRPARDCRQLRRGRQPVVDRRRQPDRRHHRRACLRPSWRPVRAAADDVDFPGHFHDRLRPLRGRAQLRLPAGRPRPAGARRRRPDDPGAGAAGGERAAAAARQLPGLSVGEHRRRFHHRAGCRRLHHPGLGLACGVPGVSAARPDRDPAGAAPAARHDRQPSRPDSISPAWCC